MKVFDGSTPEARARIRAHGVFDPLWQDGWMRRRDAYRWLSWVMGLTMKDTHIGLFTIEQCHQVIDIMEEVWRNTKGRPSTPR